MIKVGKGEPVIFESETSEFALSQSLEAMVSLQPKYFNGVFHCPSVNPLFQRRERKAQKIVCLQAQSVASSRTQVWFVYS